MDNWRWPRASELLVVSCTPVAIRGMYVPTEFSNRMRNRFLALCQPSLTPLCPNLAFGRVTLARSFDHRNEQYIAHTTQIVSLWIGDSASLPTVVVTTEIRYLAQWLIDLTIGNQPISGGTCRPCDVMTSPHPRLRPMRRRRRPRIVGPWMPRVAPLQFLLHLGIGAFPEALQILRDLDRAAGGRQQVQGNGDAAAAYAGGVGQAEQF